MPMLFLDEDDVTILLLELFLDDDDDVTVPLLLRKLQLGENVATLEELLELKLLKGDGAILTTTPPKLFLDDGAIILVGVVAMFRDPPPPPPPPALHHHQPQLVLPWLSRKSLPQNYFRRHLRF
mmetsp:Transcript_28885/g.48572  ORF Transcript_28885/g.48572 Transcript_28885/m.48572 type:complete len:124 (-) Transcript_28885:237-608(-)